MKRSVKALRQQLGLTPRQWERVCETAAAERMLPPNWCRIQVLKGLPVRARSRATASQEAQRG